MINPNDFRADVMALIEEIETELLSLYPDMDKGKHDETVYRARYGLNAVREMVEDLHDVLGDFRRMQRHVQQRVKRMQEQRV